MVCNFTFVSNCFTKNDVGLKRVLHQQSYADVESSEESSDDNVDASDSEDGEDDSDESDLESSEGISTDDGEDDSDYSDIESLEDEVSVVDCEKLDYAL